MRSFGTKSTTVVILCALTTLASALPAAEIIHRGAVDASTLGSAYGYHHFVFALYDSREGGEPLWTETQYGVELDDGRYSVYLGSVVPLDLPAGVYWLETTVDGQTRPAREKLIDLMSGGLMTGGKVGIGTDSPARLLEIDIGNESGDELVEGLRISWGPEFPLLYGEIKRGKGDGFIINSRAGGSWADIAFQTEGVTRMKLDHQGDLGIGTSDPTAMLHINNTSASGTLLKVHGGTFVSTDALRVMGNGNVGIGRSSDPTSLLHVGSATCDGTTWADASSREYKENIEELNESEAMEAFQRLRPTKFNYKSNRDELSLGFIAEDVPDLVATKDRKSLVPMDLIAVLTGVLKRQQRQIQGLEEEVRRLRED